MIEVSVEVPDPEVVGDEPRMKDAVALAQKSGKYVGTFTESVEDAKKWREIGVQYIAYSVDVGLVLNAYKEVSNKLNN